jgi:hypothetical protein
VILPAFASRKVWTKEVDEDEDVKERAECPHPVTREVVHERRAIQGTPANLCHNQEGLDDENERAREHDRVVAWEDGVLVLLHQQMFLVLIIF